MPTYLLTCADDHRFEVRQPFSAALPDCTCGQPTRKLPTAFGVVGGASLPPPASRMPQTWRGTHDGNREYLGHLRRTAEQRRSLEDRHPELQGDRRPILAHEGRYEGAPLRAGDPVPTPATEGPNHVPGGHNHSPGGHSHSPGGHSHSPSAHSHSPAPTSPSAGAPSPAAPRTTGGRGAAGGAAAPPAG